VFFVTWQRTKRRFKSVHSWTRLENIQQVWLTTAVDRRTFLSMKTAVQPRNTSLIHGGRSTLVFPHWSIKLTSPTEETPMVRMIIRPKVDCYLFFIIIIMQYTRHDQTSKNNTQLNRRKHQINTLTTLTFTIKHKCKKY